MADRRRKNPSAVKRSAEKARKASRKGTKSAVSSARLQEMIAEALADAHDDQEATVGFLSILEENIAFPFETVVLGVPAVEGLEQTSRDIAAIVARGGARQAIPIEELPLPSPPPAGSEWIEAYRIWARLV